MIEHWLSYGLADALPFTPATYARLFELTNRATWPLPLATWAAGLGALLLALRGDGWRARAALLLLAAAWAWVAWAYHLERFAPINPAAPWYAAGFALQAALLAAVAPGGGARLRWRPLGVAGAVMGLALWPLKSDFAWPAVELFGTAPDPTAIVTLSILVMATGRARWLWLVLPMPVLWCLVSALTLDAMGDPFAKVVLLLGLGGIVLAWRRSAS